MSSRLFWRVWLLALGLGTGLVLVLTGAPPVAPQSVPAGATAAAASLPEPAALPQIPARLAELTVAAQALPWGADAKAPVAAKEPPPRWSVAGTFAQAGTRRVTIRFENDKLPQVHLGAGDVLPDGRRIKAVERFRLSLLDEASGEENWVTLVDLVPSSVKSP